jgi:ABC-2 type transport system ATP-binding protein
MMLKPALPALSVTDAQLAYGKVPALRGASFDLYPGELLGLLGPNGAGKTSLIQCLAGRIRLDSGKIDCSLPGDPYEIIGIVPQEIALYQDLTVLQNLKAFARLHAVPATDIRERVTEALQWSRLQEKSKSLVRTLSGGMQRRLNIACSVLHEPEILLLDEPTVGVDPQSRESIYEMLASLLSDGTAILLATHHLEEAQNRCDRMAIIDHGKVIATGTFDQLLSETIGHSQQILVEFSTRQTHVPPPLSLSSCGHEAFGEIENIRKELPLLLDRLEADEIPVTHVNLRTPTMQHMFLHLTGKELRE